MRKRTTIRIITFLSAGLIAASTLAVAGLRRAHSLELYARANAQRAFDELVTNVSELSTALEKSLYVTDPALESALYTQVFGRAVSAQQAMGQLPWSSQRLENVSGFLSRVGDYACTLSRTVGGSGGCSEEERQNLTELSETASVMRLDLQDMQARMMAGDLTMDEVVEASAVLGGTGDAPLAGTAFQSIETEFPELPTLIYDGPFSESQLSSRPALLEGLGYASEAEAQDAAARFLSVRKDDLEALGEMGGVIPCYCYSAYVGGGEYVVYVTKQGGRILSALCSRLPGRARLTTEAGLSAADAFLEQQGLPDMERSYHMTESGVLTVNYEYVQDGAMCYPDLVKVGVALDNGAIVSYDAKGYISAHHDRELPEIAVSEAEARATIAPTLTVKAHQMAVIPSEGGEERYCHEFLCRAKDDGGYLVYVNAETGAQEKILILLEDEAGTLTI